MILDTYVTVTVSVQVSVFVFHSVQVTVSFGHDRHLSSPPPNGGGGGGEGGHLMPSTAGVAVEFWTPPCTTPTNPAAAAQNEGRKIMANGFFMFYGPRASGLFFFPLSSLILCQNLLFAARLPIPLSSIATPSNLRFKIDNGGRTNGVMSSFHSSRDCWVAAQRAPSNSS